MGISNLKWHSLMDVMRQTGFGIIYPLRGKFLVSEGIKILVILGLKPGKGITKKFSNLQEVVWF